MGYKKEHSAIRDKLDLQGLSIVSLRVRKPIVELIDQERSNSRTTRSSWIMQAIVDRLERLGHDM